MVLIQNFSKKKDGVNKKKFNVKDDEYVITFVGRLIKAKGIQDLISCQPLRINVENYLAQHL